MTSATSDLSMEEAHAQSVRTWYASDAADEVFWKWLQQELTATDYDTCREQPRGFVQQLHAAAWSDYVEREVAEEMDQWEFEQERILDLQQGMYDMQRITNADWEF